MISKSLSLTSERAQSGAIRTFLEHSTLPLASVFPTEATVASMPPLQIRAITCIRYSKTIRKFVQPSQDIDGDDSFHLFGAIGHQDQCSFPGHFQGQSGLESNQG